MTDADKPTTTVQPLPEKKGKGGKANKMKTTHTDPVADTTPPAAPEGHVGPRAHNPDHRNSEAQAVTHENGARVLKDGSTGGRIDDLPRIGDTKP
jgi:hypothetical protein